MPETLSEIRTRCARQVLHLHKRANAGHIGSSLSCLEILIDLCFRRMDSQDRVVLSKGHGASALYTTLAFSGRLPPELLETYYREGTHLAAHPPCGGPHSAIPFGTGSLGHGLGLATGLVFAQRYTGRRGHVYAVLSDGDCNEGSTWEAALFAAHHRLADLTVIVDRNRIQGIGRSDEILGLEPFVDKWRDFGFAVSVAEDGNDFDSLGEAFAALTGDSTRPRCIVAETTKGHGVSFMEDQMEWHYRPMTDEHFDRALAELGAPSHGAT